MRTGPFSDPRVVNLVNRNFVPVHLDNLDGSARRYGMEPGHENAYIILETPEVPGGPKVDTVILGRLSQVLDPDAARAEILAFLERHPELGRSAPPAGSALEQATFLLEEGEAERALDLLQGLPGSTELGLLRAQAFRLLKRFAEADSELDGLASSPEVDLERIRLLFQKDEGPRAADPLDDFLGLWAERPEAAEAYFLRGWLHHLSGRDDEAIRVWQRGIERHPPTEALFSQKAHLTLIRANWELPANVDQAK